MHKSKVVGELKTGYFCFMQLLDWTHPWAPRGPASLGKILRFQVRYIKTRNQASVHKSNVVGELSIAVILKLREGMHFSRSKNARLLNFILEQCKSRSTRIYFCCTRFSTSKCWMCSKSYRAGECPF